VHTEVKLMHTYSHYQQKYSLTFIPDNATTLAKLLFCFVQYATNRLMVTQSLNTALEFKNHKRITSTNTKHQQKI